LIFADTAAGPGASGPRRQGSRFRNRFALVLGNGVVSLLAYGLSAATLDAPHAPGCMLVTDRHISEFAIQ
jgi:hypothetical protein